MVGTNFPYTKHLPESGKCKVVQIEVDPVRAGNRIATDVPLIGDAKQSLAALAPLLEKKPDRAFLESATAANGGLAGEDGCARVDRPRPDPAPAPHARNRPTREATMRS